LLLLDIFSSYGNPNAANNNFNNNNNDDDETNDYNNDDDDAIDNDHTLNGRYVYEKL